MQPSLVLTASLELISVESVIKWRTKYVHLRQVPDAYLLDIFDNGPNPTRPTNDGNFVTQPNPWMDLTRVQLCFVGREHYKMIFAGVCLSVYLLVCHVPRPNLRTERPRKPKIGEMEAHHTGNP